MTIHAVVVNAASMGKTREPIKLFPHFINSSYLSTFHSCSRPRGIWIPANVPIFFVKDSREDSVWASTFVQCALDHPLSTPVIFYYCKRINRCEHFIIPCAIYPAHAEPQTNTWKKIYSVYEWEHDASRRDWFSKGRRLLLELVPSIWVLCPPTPL